MMVWSFTQNQTSWSVRSRGARKHWRRKWQPTPVILPRKCHGWRSLAGTVHGVAEWDTTEWLHFHFHFRKHYCKASRGDGVPAELFQILKMMLLKCHTQYVSKFGKLSSGPRTGEGQFAFQSPRKAVLGNAQTARQPCSFHTLARLWSESFKPGFSSAGAENFQMFKLDLENAEDQTVNICWIIRENKGIPEKHLLLHWLWEKLWLCGSQQTVENS